MKAVPSKASESKSTATGRTPKTATEEKLEQLIVEEENERNLGKIDDLQNLRFERRKAALQHEIKVLKGEVVEKKDGVEVAGSTAAATPQLPVTNIINPDVIKAISSLPEGKQAKAWESVMEYQTRALNPNIATVKYIVDALKEKPEGDVKQMSSIDLLQEVLKAMKLMREESAALNPPHPVTPPQPPPKTFFDEIEEEAKKKFREKMIKYITGEESTNQPKIETQAGVQGLQWDPQRGTYMPDKLTYPQYLELDELMYKRKKEEKADAEKEKKDERLKEQFLEPLMSMAKKHLPTVVKTLSEKNLFARQQQPVQEARPSIQSQTQPRAAVSRKSKVQEQYDGEVQSQLPIPMDEPPNELLPPPSNQPPTDNPREVTFSPSEVREVDSTMLEDGSVVFPCTKCNTSVRVLPQDLGKKIKCPRCGNVHEANKKT